MPFNLLQRLAGIRKTLITTENIHDYVEVLCWKNPELIPGHHLGLRVIKQGKEIRYISFQPNDWTNLDDNPSLTRSIEAFFLEKYKDEALYQGFRNSWHDVEFNDEQKALLVNDSIRRVSDENGLKIAKKFSREQAREFRERAHPERVILRSLDLDRIIEEIDAYIQAEAQAKITWSFWGAASLFRPAKVHNCASIMLDILNKAGLGNLLTASQDVMGMVGLIIGAIYAFKFEEEWSKALLEVVVGFFAGRFVGGMYEGYTGIQGFLNLLNAQGKDNVFAVWGLRLVSTAVSGLVGAVKTGLLVPLVLVTPHDVMRLVHQAEEEEAAGYTHRVPKLARNREEKEELSDAGLAYSM